jgi:trk system potassium uptake protein TrkH
MGVAGMVLFRIELSPLARDNFRQSMRETSRILLYVYGGLTLAETIALVAVGMNLFDAVTHSFATIATGGFSPRNASIGAYDSPAIEGVIMLFMLLSGVHFGLLFSTLIQRRGPFWKSVVFRYYVTAILIGVVVVTIALGGQADNAWIDSVRHGAFQVISLGTSTGFATADSSVWPPLAQIMLMFFALQCACAGSTSGGIKADRFVLFGKGIWKQIRHARHPRAIIPLRVDGKAVDDQALAAAMLYIGLYATIVISGGLLLMVLGLDPLSAFSGTIATTGNVGPGLGTVGSFENFAGVPGPGKWILTGTMLLGRLEIYGLIMLLMPSVWRRLATPARQEFQRVVLASRR